MTTLLGFVEQYANRIVALGGAIGVLASSYVLLRSKVLALLPVTSRRAAVAFAPQPTVLFIDASASPATTTIQGGTSTPRPRWGASSTTRVLFTIIVLLFAAIVVVQRLPMRSVTVTPSSVETVFIDVSDVQVFPMSDGAYAVTVRVRGGLAKVPTDAAIYIVKKAQGPTVAAPVSVIGPMTSARDKVSAITTVIRPEEISPTSSVQFVAIVASRVALSNGGQIATIDGLKVYSYSSTALSIRSSQTGSPSGQSGTLSVTPVPIDVELLNRLLSPETTDRTRQ